MGMIGAYVSYHIFCTGLGSSFTIRSVWAIASAIGPPVGGAFSQTNWRWLFCKFNNICLTATLLMTLVI